MAPPVSTPGAQRATARMVQRRCLPTALGKYRHRTRMKDVARHMRGMNVLGMACPGPQAERGERGVAGAPPMSQERW